MVVAQTSPWPKRIAIVAAALGTLVVIVIAAKVFRGSPAGADFLTTYPGETELPSGSPTGFPVWLNWQHFLNALFLILIVKSGWSVRTMSKSPGNWTRRNTGLLKTKRAPTKINLYLLLHLGVDFLWVLNGAIFIVLLFATGQWLRIVPTSWEVIPNAVSAAIQYASLVWPTEDGWSNYNSLQLLSYFLTTFIAAPLAIITGLRMSPAWPTTAGRVNRLFPITLARAIHFPVMIYFVAFVVVHVTLVLATGALRNLNHMYASRDDQSWWGLAIFAVSLIVMAGAWFLASPTVVRMIAAPVGKISR